MSKDGQDKIKTMRSTLLFLLLGGAVAAGGRMLERPPSATRPTIATGEARDLAALLPETCALKIVIDGGPASVHGGGLALAALRSEPEVAAFLEPLGETVDGLLGSFELVVRDYLGLSVDETLKLLQYRTTVALCGLEPPADGQPLPRPDIVLALEFGDDLEMMRRLMFALEKAVLAWGEGRFTDDTIAGMPVRRYVPDPARPGTPPAWYIVEDRTLLLATNRGTFEAVIKRMKSGATEGSLASSARNRAVAARIERPASLLSIYADVPRLIEMVGPMVGIPSGESLAGIGGLDGIEAIGYGLDIDGEGLRDRAFVKLAAGPLRDALQCSKPSQLHRVVPASTALFGSVQFEVAKVWSHLRETLAKSDPRTAEALEEGQRSARDLLTFDLEADLLPRLGPEWGMALSWPGKALIPDALMFIELKDRPEVARLLETGLKALDMPVSSLDHGQRKIHVLDLSRLPSNGFISPRPTWTFVDDFLVVSLWPQAARNFLDHVDAEGPTLDTTDDFKRVLARLRADDPKAARNSVSYVDLKGLIGFICDNGVPMAQTFLPPSDREFGDWVRFPHTETITDHLFGLGGGGRWTEDGYYAEFWSPTGYLGPYLLGTGFASYAWLRQVEMVRAESEAAVRREERMRAAVPFEIDVTPPSKKDKGSKREKKGGK